MTKLARATVCLTTVVVIAPTATVLAIPEFVEHDPLSAVYGESADVTMREPEVVREDEPVTIWIRIGYSFYYDSVAVYYTTDGTGPGGSYGVPAGTSSALVWTDGAGDLQFVRNEPHSPDAIDWWRAELPVSTRDYGTTVKYRIGAWASGGGGEIFANNYGCADGTCDDPAAPATTFEYTVKLVWPGRGAPNANPDEGYPNVYFWKEEGVVGNNFINVMLDQNGSLYDVYYPSAGCIRGVGTKNEGYVDGLDTFPPLLPPGDRGQMHLNQAMAGIRVDGVTYWLSNEQAAGYSDVSQQYVFGTNVITTSQRLTAGGNDILIEQHDFAPKGIVFPLDGGGNPNRGLHVKRMVLTNNGGTDKTVNFYWYADFALNGGDGYDGTYADTGRGAIIGVDNIERWTSASGEYNPTTTGDYHKDVSVYLASALRMSDAVGGSSGTPASDFWSDTSSDQGLGWVGMQVELPVGMPKEVGVLTVGGFDGFAGATGTYDVQMAPMVDWFLTQDLSALQATTETYWQDWLANGVTIDLPDDAYDEIFERGLLATALHLDGINGGIIAGMHNGAYPFVWPRDGVWAAVTLDRAGHAPEAEGIYSFLRDVAYRAEEEPGRKGWWYQKYTTDGHTVWSAPQVDETAVYPWGILYHYDVEGDIQFLADHYVAVYEAARAMSEDSNIDSRIYFDDPFNLMYSNNLWEDSFGDFLYSNANVERGLRDAAEIADILDQQWCPGGPGTCNYHNDRALFESRADIIHGGVTNRLIWDGENTDISQLGLVYPFDVYSAEDPLIAHAVDRINGVAGDKDGNIHPLVNFSGEWQDLINRYWNDAYWNNPAAPNPNGSPWFLTTMWYGCYYAQRQDFNPGTGDINNHKYRIDLLLDRLGPIGLGAEQISPSNSLLYPGETNFVLQTAWPNAWESMSFFVDAVMLFLDYEPGAPGSTLRIEPKLPDAWPTMTYRNLRVGDHRVNVTCATSPTCNSNTFTNVTGNAVDFDTHIRVPAGTTVFAAARNGSLIGHSYDPGTGRVHVTGALETGGAATTEVCVYYGTRGDGTGDGAIDLSDHALLTDCLTGPKTAASPACRAFDFDEDDDVDEQDFAAFSLAESGV